MKTGIEFDADAVFADEFARATEKEERKSGFPLEQWFKSGPQKPETSRLWWEENGADLARRYIDWYENEPDASIWVTPDGQPAIELDLLVSFGSVKVRMQIDQVLQLGTALVVVDLKTSVKAPESFRQLGIYASGVELAYGIRPRYGAYFLPRDDSMRYFRQPVILDGPQYSVPYLTEQFEQFTKARKAGFFLANPGRACGRCGVAYACLANGGAKAREHDPSHPHHRP